MKSPLNRACRPALVTRVLYGTAIVVLASTFVTVLTAEKSVHCDARVRRPEGDRGYQERGRDRCEGTYSKPQSQDNIITLVSLIKAATPFDNQPGKTVELSWTGAGEGPVHLLAISTFKSKRFYRMDSVRGAGEQAFAWRTDELFQSDVRQSDLGLLAWTGYPSSSQGRPQGKGVTLPLYLPLDVSQGLDAAQKAARVAGRSLELLLETGTGVSRVDLALHTVTPQGQPDALVHEHPIENPASSDSTLGPIKLQFPAQVKPGIHVLIVTATPLQRDTPPVTEQFYIYLS